jgi:hypothetical protein
MVKLRRGHYRAVEGGDNPFRRMKVEPVTDACEKCGRLWISHSDEQFRRCASDDAEPWL